MRCKSDVFQGDIVRVDGTLLVVISSMNSNNGNYKAKDKYGRLKWCNMLSTEVVKRCEGTEGLFI